MATVEELTKRIEDDIKAQILKNRTGDAPETKEPEDLAVEVKAKEKGANQKMFTEVFGVRLTGANEKKDFPLTVYKKGDWHEAVRAFVPEADPNYEVQVDEALKLAQAIEEGDKTLLTGPTGSGKSSLVKYVCAKLGRPFIRCNMNGDIESSALFGCIVVENGGTVWKDGAATEAILYGAVLLIDEWEIMPPDIGMGFQCVLEDNGFLFLKEKPGTSEEKMIIPHEQFRLVYAGNTVGQGDETGSFAGANVQNTATIDRFQTTIVLDYLDKGHETKVIKGTVPGIKPDIVKKMLQFAELVRTSNRQGNLTLTMSPRTLINWGRKIMRYGDIKEALLFSFINKLNTNDKKLCLDFYMKVFGK
jgi:cobaltochelatase CobS